MLIPTILGQKVQVVAAQRSYRALCQRYGGPAPGPFPLLLPPDPERLAHAGYEHFHPMNVERRRADVVRRVAARQTRIDRLVFEHPPAEVRGASATSGGSVTWTSASATLLVCGDPDAMILGDFHLPNFVAWTLAGEPRGDDPRMQVLLEPFTGHHARVQLLAMRTGSAPPRRGARLSIRDIRNQ